MRKRVDEINQIPPDHQNDSEKEFAALPDEFNRFAPAGGARKEDKRHVLRKVMLLLAASGLTVLGVFAPVAAQPSGDPSAEAPAQTAAPTPEPAAEPTVTPTPEPAAEPTAEPTPEPTAEPTPGIITTFFRRSQVYGATVLFSKPESLLRAEVRIKDPDIGEPAIEHTLTAEEIANGRCDIDNYEPYDFYFAHSDEYGALNREPELVIEVTAVYRTEAGEETLTDSSPAETELWVDIGYDSEENRDILEMMYGTVYPDCFVIRIDEVPFDDLQILMNAGAEALVPGGVSVSIEVDGVALTGEGATLEKGKYMYDGQIFYYYTYIIPRPETIPEHGTVHYTILQRLIHFDSFQTRERDKTY